MATTHVPPVKTQLAPSSVQSVAPSTGEQKANLTKPQSGLSQPTKPRFSLHDVKVQFGTSEINSSSCEQKNPAFEYVFRPKAGSVEGYFPRRGTSLIGGASGSGKTTLVLDMTNELRQGHSFLGHSSCPQPFSYISLERSKEGFERTCKRMNFDPRWFNFYRPTGSNRQLPLPELIEGLLGTPEHRESKIFFIEGMDIRLDDDGKHRTMNDPTAVAQLMGQLEDLGKKHGLTFVGTVGMPKMKPGDKYTGRDQIIGSSFWARHAETIFTTTANADEDGLKSCTLQIWMRNGQDEEFMLGWKDGRLAPTEPKSSKLPLDYVIEWLEKNRKVGETFSIENLVAGLKGSQPTISQNTIQYVVANEKNLTNLVRSGFVEKPAHGLYRWKGKPPTLAEAKKAANEKVEKQYTEDVQKILTLIEPWKLGEPHDFTTAAHHENLPFGFSQTYLLGMSKDKLKGVLSVTPCGGVGCVRLVHISTWKPPVQPARKDSLAGC